ncbi:hypothetical protein MYCTH_2296392 [Thermothelomyces thermophilus ATCC 42464]|uniref:Uncharacterized protein n=1 Tax=Thermothelomyces thermophilus (strain ATCC 42464 / BCRC 31852 / DSM 1799) TaxID=573729 RepID=G2Q1H0_THET4|nr:uncharacterized protein MYCTH_2296392 [Thermothelomyces thermophilus ATCC 42464]AEO54160.1 hypothetical protein MYCTH_2296392 [Thermothelomyces thermophilus ATCC 42464]
MKRIKPGTGREEDGDWLGESKAARDLAAVSRATAIEDNRVTLASGFPPPAFCFLLPVSCFLLLLAS